MIKIIDKDTVHVTELPIDRMEIVTEDCDLTKIYIFMLDDEGNRVEGGTFDRSAFMDHILEFYNANY